MAAPHVSTIPIIFFGKHIVRMPYGNRNSDHIDAALTRWMAKGPIPDEVDHLLRRYPLSLLRFLTFRPISLEKAEGYICENRLFLEEVVDCGQATPIRVLELDNTLSMISFAIDYPASLAEPEETNPGAVILSCEWFDFLAARNWSEACDGRLNLDSNAQLVVEGPGTPANPCSYNSDYTYESHIVKFATDHELIIHDHLEEVHDDAVLQWPESLCRIQRSYPPEPLPNGETIVCFPDYGVSLHGAWRTPEESLIFSTLWDCVYQLVTAVEYLHSKCVAHLDIKPGNVALRVEPCTVCPPSGVDTKTTHFHPYLTLIDLGSAEVVNSPSGLLAHTAGTSGCVAPEVQPFHRRIRRAGYFPPQYDTDSDSDPDSDATAVDTDCKSRKAPYNPFSADVWAVGHVLHCMANIVTNEKHGRAIQELGESIMIERPSAELVAEDDDVECPLSLRMSELRRMVQEKEEMAGLEKIDFCIGPATRRNPELVIGPITPLF